MSAPIALVANSWLRCSRRTRARTRLEFDLHGDVDLGSGEIDSEKYQHANAPRYHARRRGDAATGAGDQRIVLHPEQMEPMATISSGAEVSVCVCVCVCVLFFPKDYNLGELMSNVCVACVRGWAGVGACSAEGVGDGPDPAGGRLGHHPRSSRYRSAPVRRAMPA